MFFILCIGCSRPYIIPSYNQVSDADLHPMIASDKVGETIDTLERRQFDLFPNVDDFGSAVIYQIGKDDPEFKSGYVVEIIRTDGRKYRTVNRDPKGVEILRDYLGGYDRVNATRKFFEYRWHIVDYDENGLPITFEEMIKYRKHRNINMDATLGFIAGGGLGLAWGFLTTDRRSDDRANDIAFKSFALGSMGCVVGSTIGRVQDNKAALNAIKQGRKLRGVE